MPAGSEVSSPPESRGIARDGVRLMVAQAPDRIEHVPFREIVHRLRPGDLVVVNTSRTLPAAVDGRREDATMHPVHIAADLGDGDWVAEIRRADNTAPDSQLDIGERVLLTGGLGIRVVASYPEAGRVESRLWRVRPDDRRARISYLLEHGRPIRYAHLTDGADAVALDALQNVYALQPGSAEMPSAGRPFSREVLVGLMARGITVAPIVLHTGVSSPEKHEPPAAEPFSVPAATARLVTSAHSAGGRVVAVGTTVVRALETAADPSGAVRARAGWTELVLSRDRPARVVDGLVTGLHEPEASHLHLLEAVAGRALVDAAYDEAVRHRYLWHEFGDSMLFLPDGPGRDRRPARAGEA